jgi:methionyl aminopeptidase
MDLSGHGVGLAVHEEPSIRSDGSEDSGEPLKEGMVLAIEPMATPGSGKVATADDGWTVKTVDGALAAHFEHTVAVTKTGFKILTVR